MHRAGFLIFLVCYLALFLIYILSTKEGPIPANGEQRTVQRKHTFQILIQSDLFWTLQKPISKTELIDRGCPVNNCNFTRPFFSLTSSTADFDVIIFLPKHKLLEDLDQANLIRRPDQLYVLLMSEPPSKIYHLESPKLKDQFNWTVSYRMEADIRRQYGEFTDKLTKEEVAPNFHPKWKRYDPQSFRDSYLPQSEIPRIVAGKTKLAAWFVSNCDHAPSKRMELVREMQKYIPIDIYGKCGNLTCDVNDKAMCREMVQRDYKFYLSFENSLCRDYISQKTFLNLAQVVVPVSYNGADPNRFLPPHSFVNVEDFDTVKQLTDYMLFLADNPDEYMSFFWWKEHYEVGRKDYYCDLCIRLNERDENVPIIAHPDIRDWYAKGVCSEPKWKME